MSSVPKRLIEVNYESYAQEYLRKLRPEHYMEATDQARQREITLESLALVKPRRKDFHVFNELLVQYPRKGKKRPGQVVPDNMVVVSDQPLTAESSFNTPGSSRPDRFWVLEYVSKSNKRKDYEDSFKKYEEELKVPYYLVFYPETQDLSLYRHTRRKIRLGQAERAAATTQVPEVDIEVALLDGWVRFWYRGELLPLPAELQRSLEEAEQRAGQAEQRAQDLQNALLRRKGRNRATARPEPADRAMRIGRDPTCAVLVRLRKLLSGMIAD